MMHPVIPYVFAALLFGLGAYGVLARRNAVLVLMAVELMLNAVNVLLITADATVAARRGPGGHRIGGALADGGRLAGTGQVFALFVIVLAAAEIGVGLAIVLHMYRLRATVAVDEVSLDRPAMIIVELPGGPDGPDLGGPVPDGAGPDGPDLGGPESDGAGPTAAPVPAHGAITPPGTIP
jgi:NADH-quinone oxidoreductase subunit K